ncbi:vacuolar protein sorting-associated protein 11 [Polychaeton citri CBS 116435]|uniref:E3 ubiquitin-protein ligase PEP5 n=1 Tax=Polychaeton citri CBS 116435 TaxID=1314669 RepID=A0A9P4UKJ3_9PEZI|nr:vacuolar protein sorting-associated protein 11 [Polychaeton citri CBS 116435]
MTMKPWKAFPFFDVSQVRLSTEDGFVALDQGSISAFSAGSSNILVGLQNGYVHLLDQTFKSSRTWKAHDASNITHVHQVPDTAWLVTLSEDLAREPQLKVWALDQTERKNSSLPKLLCALTVQNGRKNFPVTAFAVSSDLTQLAVGFGNGTVTVVRGDFIHDRGTRQRTVFESEEPITGLEFREANTVALYIGTTSRLLSLAISGKAQGSPARALDENGCAVGCMALDPVSNDIIIAREDAVYAYGPRSKAASYPFEGAKKLIAINKDYVMIVSPPNNTLQRSASLRAFGGSIAGEILNSSTFKMLNTDLKFIAHSETVQSQINRIISIWGDVFLLTIDGKLYRYHEKTFQQKLDIIYRQNLFELAIALAKKHNVNEVQQNVIFRKFGDYLYQKGDFDTAMQQYLRAIDNTEPSQVIRRYLDNQRIHNLIDYLEELHEHEKATSDHTTLLLNCYAKLKDVEKLESFIKQPGDLKFDLDTAIVMCRQGSYYDQAAFLARRHEEHGLVVDILIEDLKKYAESLAYIWRLQPVQAYAALMKYGTVLLDHESKDATRLFIDYFTGTFRPKKDAVIIQETPASEESGGGLGAVATSAVQSLVTLIPLPYMSTSASQTSKEGMKSQAQVIETTTEGDYVQYDVPKPRTAFSAFIDHPDEFITFLEACIANEGVKNDNKADLHTTLFEIYLHKANTSSSDQEKQTWEQKAKSLLESKDVPIDTSNALLLSDLEQFREGTILVSEKQGLRADIFRSYTATRDTAGAVKALHKYGPEEPSLYPAALAYFTSSPEILAEVGPVEIDAVLKKIDEDGLMAPLQVIQTLSLNSVATMGLVKKYLSSTVKRERDEISSNRRLIDSYRADTETKLKELQELKEKPTSFSATRCASCGGTMDLPTMHFMCKHSFHQRCINVGINPSIRASGEGGESDDVECPICTPQNETARAIKQAQEESIDKHDVFVSALERAGSGERFGMVGEWFGRGVMGVKSADG